MKKILIGMISGLAFITACSSEKNESSENIEFKMTQDTVVVDSKEDIINLEYGLFNVELTKDGKYLFHYWLEAAKFSKVNLEDLVLEENIQFEKEGPDGMGTYLGGYSLNSEDQIMMWSYGLNAIFDQSGKKVKNLRLDKIAQEEINGSEGFPIRLIEHPKNPNIIFGLYVKWEGFEYFLLKFDVEKETFEKIPLPETERLKEFRMEIELDGRSAGSFGSFPSVTEVNERIILTNSAFNEAYVYDMNLDSLYLISWNSTLTGNKNEAKLPKKVQIEEREQYSKIFYESINFMPPSWDPISQQFVRLSFKNKFGEELNENGEAKVSNSEVFMTVLDKNLKIIKESKLENYTKRPPKYFFIDNTIWLYENIGDELGFVRMTIN